MNIQIVSQYYYPDHFKINAIASQLVAMGNQVRVLTGLPDYATSVVPNEYKYFRKRKEVIDGVSVTRVPIIARRRGVFFRTLNYISFAVAGSISALFSSSSCDVIFVNQTSPVLQAIPALVYKFKTHKKIILYCYDLWPESMKAWGTKENSLIFQLVRKASAWIYNSCDIIAVTSTVFKAYLHDVCGVDESKIFYLPQYAEDISPDIVGKYLDNECVDFLFAGNIGAVQNLDYILRATQMVKTKKAFHIHLVGDGSEMEALKQLSSTLGIDGKITFHGRYSPEDMTKFYELADCFILSLRGGDFIGMTLPGKAQVYLSLGKPILAAMDGDGKDLVKNSDCGEAVSFDDLPALAKAMTRMIEDFGCYKEKGLNGRRVYEKTYTMEIFFDSLNKLLQ